MAARATCIVRRRRVVDLDFDDHERGIERLQPGGPSLLGPYPTPMAHRLSRHHTSSGLSGSCSRVPDRHRRRPLLPGLRARGRELPGAYAPPVGLLLLAYLGDELAGCGRHPAVGLRSKWGCAGNWRPCCGGRSGVRPRPMVARSTSSGEGEVSEVARPAPLCPRPRRHASCYIFESRGPRC